MYFIHVYMYLFIFKLINILASFWTLQGLYCCLNFLKTVFYIFINLLVLLVSKCKKKSIVLFSSCYLTLINLLNFDWCTFGHTWITNLIAFNFFFKILRFHSFIKIYLIFNFYYVLIYFSSRFYLFI